MKKPDVSFRCQAVSKRTQKRCQRDATSFHGSKSLCSQHHAKALEEKRNERKA